MGGAVGFWPGCWAGARATKAIRTATAAAHPHALQFHAILLTLVASPKCDAKIAHHATVPCRLLADVSTFTRGEESCDVAASRFGIGAGGSHVKASGGGLGGEVRRIARNVSKELLSNAWTRAHRAGQTIPPRCAHTNYEALLI